MPLVNLRMATSTTLLVIILLLGCSTAIPGENVTIHFSDDSVDIQIGATKNITLALSDHLTKDTAIVFMYGDQYVDSDHYIKAVPNISILADDNKTSWPVEIIGANAGHIVLGVNSSSSEIVHINKAFVRINVVHSSVLVIINAVIGWIYFAAWSVSFYPQVVYNFRRKSVVGLNFDFLCYNITGFVAYGFYNVGMYWIPLVKEQYADEHPRGINPVQLNDVVFTLHAILITVFTIIQCFIYERGAQKVSKLCIVLVTCAWLFAGSALVVALVHKINWLTYLNYFSYIKLGITLIKYMPQAYMNFRRKSTIGWSIGNILLDFTGGALSLLQMFLLSYNSDDWGSIFGDPTKFGLGFFSIIFDILFIVQHYCLYRGNEPYEPIQEYKYEVNTGDHDSSLLIF